MRSPDTSIAWKSAPPSSDTEVHDLAASSERIRPSTAGSPVSSAAGWPEPSSSSGPTNWTTSCAEILPAPSGVVSVPVTRSGRAAPSGTRKSPVLVAIHSTPVRGVDRERADDRELAVGIQPRDGEPARRFARRLVVAAAAPAERRGADEQESEYQPCHGGADLHTSLEREECPGLRRVTLVTRQE